MRRREFLGVLGGAAAAWPLTARAQQSAKPVIGLLHSGSRMLWEPLATEFRKGLNESGYIDGQNVTFEYRWADGRFDRLPALASDLVSRGVEVIFATGGPPSALAAKLATATVPVVFLMGDDPVRHGLVASLNRPEANITGVSFFNAELVSKRFGLLHELMPRAIRMGLLVNPANPESELQPASAQHAARTLGIDLQVLEARTPGEIEAAFATFAKRRTEALVVGGDPLFSSQRQQLVTLAARHSIPAIYSTREHVEAGGLISYGSSRAEAYRKAGSYVGRILSGTKPAGLPVVRATKFEMIINPKTARALGLAFPNSMQLLADGVVE